MALSNAPRKHGSRANAPRDPWAKDDLMSREELRRKQRDNDLKYARKNVLSQPLAVFDPNYSSSSSSSIPLPQLDNDEHDYAGYLNKTEGDVLDDELYPETAVEIYPTRAELGLPEHDKRGRYMQPLDKEDFPTDDRSFEEMGMHIVSIR